MKRKCKDCGGVLSACDIGFEHHKDPDECVTEKWRQRAEKAESEVERLKDKAPAKCICSSYGCNPDCEYEGHHENEVKDALKCIEQNLDLMQSRADKALFEVARLKRGLKDLLAAYESLLPEDVNPGANAVSFKARQLIGAASEPHLNTLRHRRERESK